MNRNLNKESLLAVYISKGINKKVNYYCFPIIKKEKWLKGAKTKYDIPQYIEGIPEGFAIFCTTKEAGKVRKYQERIERKNRMKEKEIFDKKKITNNELNREVEDMDVINKRLIVGAINNINRNEENNQKENNEIENEDENEDNSIINELQEPLPRIEHKYCYICKTKFEKYIEHIRSNSHFENLSRHKNLFIRIRKSFEKIINFWEIKDKNKKNKNYIINRKIFLSSTKEEESQIKGKNNQNKKFNIINLIEKKRNKNKKIKDFNENIKRLYKINKNQKYFSNKNEFLYSTKRIILNNKHIINLKINKSNNKNIFINKTFNEYKNKKEKDHSNKNINIININNNDDDDERTMKTFNDNQILIYKEDTKQPKFVTKYYPKFSTLQMRNISKPKKRKKNELIKGGDIFVISTPRKIDLDYFPILSIENSNKLINKNILFFN